jgi:23S rRNA pseudouridine1911/1915/1917 synthase
VKRKRFRVSAREEGQDLQTFLASHFSMSRRKVKAILDARSVFVNGRRIWMARHVLTAGDRVEADEAETSTPDGRPPALDVLCESDGFIIIDKPAGMLSNGDPASAESVLQRQLGDPAIVAVHRLDKDTTGCLLLARSDEWFDLAVQRFRAQHVRKIYHAIVQGHFPDKTGTINTPLDGRTAATRVEVLDGRHEASHVRVTLQTGRTHQIRRHLAQQGHPVLGDRQYGTRRRLSGKASQVGRQMLHASALEIDFPDGSTRTLRAKAPLPRDFRQCLRSFRLS